MWEIGRVAISQITFLLTNSRWQQIYLKCKYLNTHSQAQLPFFFFPCSQLDPFRVYKYPLRKQESMPLLGSNLKILINWCGLIIRGEDGHGTWLQLGFSLCVLKEMRHGYGIKRCDSWHRKWFWCPKRTTAVYSTRISAVRFLYVSLWLLLPVKQPHQTPEKWTCFSLSIYFDELKARKKAPAGKQGGGESIAASFPHAGRKTYRNVKP